MFQFITIARNSCPGICHHLDTLCIYFHYKIELQIILQQFRKLSISYTITVQCCWKEQGIKRKNEQRNDCLEIWFNLSLPAWPLFCEVQGCNLVKIQKKQTVTEDSFKLISEKSKSCNVKFYILIYNKSHGVTQSNSP